MQSLFDCLFHFPSANQQESYRLNELNPVNQLTIFWKNRETQSLSLPELR
jgi:hypothetical protein